MKIWTLSTAAGQFCGFPLVSCATSGYGDRVLDIPGDGPVWGWTPPGDLRLAQKYGLRTIADVELRQWSGGHEETLQAKALADLAGGVTSHGFVPAALRDVLGEFVMRDRVGYPQVYDSDRSTPPDSSFIAKCVESWGSAGFARIVPLLGASAGPARLAAWAAYCRREDLEFHFWDLVDAKRIGCQGLAALVAGGELADDGDHDNADNAKPPPGLTPRFWIGLGLGSLLAAAAGALVGFNRRPAAGRVAPEDLAEMNVAELRAAFRQATGRPPPPSWERDRLIRELLP